jgi:hypothetical protein
MRDRSAARNHSPQRDAFRREHQRRRDHGKAQRHAERIYRAFQQSCSDEVPRIPGAESSPPPAPPTWNPAAPPGS